VVDRVIDYEATGAAGVEDAVVGVFSTRTVKVGGGECSCVKGGPEDWFASAIRTLMDYSIVDIEVSDVFGDPWPMISTDEREGVVTSIARVVSHPLAPWVISVPLLSLRRSMSHPCGISGSAEKGGRRVINRLVIFLLHIWVDDVGEDGDVSEVREVVEGIVGDEDRVGRLAAPAHDSNSRHEMVCPLFDDVKGCMVSCSIPYDTSCHSLHVLYLFLAGRDAVFAIRGRWRDGQDRLTYCP